LKKKKRKLIPFYIFNLMRSIFFFIINLFLGIFFVAFFVGSINKLNSLLTCILLFFIIYIFKNYIFIVLFTLLSSVFILCLIRLNIFSDIEQIGEYENKFADIYEESDFDEL
jgi:hypothetical protein